MNPSSRTAETASSSSSSGDRLDEESSKHAPIDANRLKHQQLQAIPNVRGESSLILAGKGAQGGILSAQHESAPASSDRCSPTSTAKEHDELRIHLPNTPISNPVQEVKHTRFMEAMRVVLEEPCAARGDVAVAEAGHKIGHAAARQPEDNDDSHVR